MEIFMLLKFKINRNTLYGKCNKMAQWVKKSMNIKKKKILLRNTLCLLCLTFAGSNVYAENNDDLQLHGFLSQGLIDVNGSNFVNDKETLSAELTEVGFNASYRLSSDFRFAGQIVYLNGGNRYNDGVRIDYALIDWSAYSDENWLVNFYLGRFKNNHWLYSSTRDVPFARPSIILPKSTYFDGFRDLAVGGNGLAMRANYSSMSMGDFDFNLSYGQSDISKKQTKIILGKIASGNMKIDSDIQASVYWQPVLSQWRFGVAALDATFDYNSGDLDPFIDATLVTQRVLINALYEGEFWEFSGEMVQDRLVLDGLYFPELHSDVFSQGYYIQSRYQLTPELKALMRIERFYRDKNDKNGSEFKKSTNGSVAKHFGFQHDITFGLSYDLAKNMRLQAEYHWVDGTARLTPVLLPNVSLNNEQHWQMWAIQLMYWF